MSASEIKGERAFPEVRPTAFVFDLDGTLIDSVYQHVIAWHEALRAVGLELSVWRIHRKIGMSGGLFARGVLRETGREFTAAEVEELHALHGKYYLPQVSTIEPLPGAVELLAHLTATGIPWAIATSGRRRGAAPYREKLSVPDDVPMITRDEVSRAKPDPDLFLAGAAALGMDPADTIVVGDSVWDMLGARRAGALGVGLLSGGYGQQELESAHAFRVYADPADLLVHIDELGIRAA